ncbi:hypothetical protein [uncultured Azohydromonas sp.]|jgi:hypothetical protein|uniref:hypothetical protein n=1 Tax=uncultured Azohydromonas sp. TaxID=487342 RepID=UPI0026047D3A|nr:hypothetical protein [uncultured Azohydromonas sp.]
MTDTATTLPHVIEQIAQEWDGRTYEVSGEAVDIGAAIRAAAARLLAAPPAASAGPDPHVWMRSELKRLDKTISNEQ